LDEVLFGVGDGVEFLVDQVDEVPVSGGGEGITALRWKVIRWQLWIGRSAPLLKAFRTK
jgi:hypothetical protein